MQYLVFKYQIRSLTLRNNIKLESSAYLISFQSYWHLKCILRQYFHVCDHKILAICRNCHQHCSTIITMYMYILAFPTTREKRDQCILGQP